MVVLYVICSFALIQGVVSLIQGILSVKHMRSYRPRTRWRPSIVIFCPCKGVDFGFRENVVSILRQDYPAFRVVFIVDSASDPATRVLTELGASILTATKATSRSQKVQNLIYAVESDGARDAEVYVFCDADARFPSDWLQKLIAPLEDDNVAVSTGYRWYAAESGSLPSLLRSTWNASVVTALGKHGRNFAWGGSMALRRDVFDRIGVRQA